MLLTLIPILFGAGVLTILLPCILPLVPIVLGTSIAGRSKLRPLMVIIGMVLSFVVLTFILTVLLGAFPKAADYIRIATYYILLLFGVGFVSHNVWVMYGSALGGAFFFWPDAPAIITAAILGSLAMHVGGMVASWLQNVGSHIQQQTRETLGADNAFGAFIMGSTLGLVWVPCAGPALSFVFTLLRDKPGIEAIILLLAYGLGTALPLLLIGYGGQYAVHSVHALSRWSGYIKKVAGGILILSAFALQFHWFQAIETWIVVHTPYGQIGTELEEKWFGESLENIRSEQQSIQE